MRAAPTRPLALAALSLLLALGVTRSASACPSCAGSEVREAGGAGAWPLVASFLALPPFVAAGAALILRRELRRK